MTDEKLIREFRRWILAGRPKVWYKRNDDDNWDYVSGVPLWNSEDIYIVDDEQAELRKLQIDEPDTKFQIKVQDEWEDAESEELWLTKYKYRVRPKGWKEWYRDEAMVGKPIWVRDDDRDEWDIDMFVDYIDDEECPFECRNSSWVYAKPIKLKNVTKEEKMTKEQLKREFARWIDAGKPVVGYKRNDGSWGYVSGVPSWNSEDIYIVDDEQAELRKLRIDKPDTKFQWYNKIAKEWQTIQDLNWDFNPNVKYRVKRTKWYKDPAMIGKPVWVRNKNNGLWEVELFRAYDKDTKFPFYTNFDYYKQAKPVKPEECYQGGKDD